MSQPIDLKEGRGFYIESLMTDSTGRDHLAIGVKLPDGQTLKPIPKKYLTTDRIGKVFIKTSCMHRTSNTTCN